MAIRVHQAFQGPVSAQTVRVLSAAPSQTPLTLSLRVLMMDSACCALRDGPVLSPHKSRKIAASKMEELGITFLGFGLSVGFSNLNEISEKKEPDP